MRWLSTRELADAIGVSESSLKRWVDAGKITASRTDGGHRRIELAEALRFIRESGTPIVHPEMLDLPDVAAARERPHPRLLDYLLDGDTAGARGWLTSRYMAGATFAELGDGPIRDAMHAIGELWRHDERGVFVEHRATDACLNAIAQLRNELHAAPPRAPCAVGCAPSGDPYLIPSQLACLVAAEAGMRAVNLGADLPADALERAVIELKAKLVWISVSVPLESKAGAAFARALDKLPRAATIIVGGREASALPLAPRIRRGASMADLATLAHELVERR